MENPCYKCGQTVEEGVRFCPHCSAPQIRVVIAEPAPSPLAFATATSPDSDALPASQTIPVLTVPMQWSQALRPCALAAVVAFLIGLLSQSLLLAMLAGGFLAVIFYGRRRSVIPLRTAEAAKLGALAGVLVSAIVSLLIAFVVTIPDARTKMQDQCVEIVQKFGARFPATPNIQASIDLLKTPQGFVAALVEACVFLFLVSIVLGGLGGALGGVILGRRDKS
jgi:hypothetical protein